MLVQARQVRRHANVSQLTNSKFVNNEQLTTSPANEASELWNAKMSQRHVDTRTRTNVLRVSGVINLLNY